MSSDIQNEIPVDSQLEWFDTDFWQHLRELLKGLVNGESFGTQDALRQLLLWVRTIRTMLAN